MPNCLKRIKWYESGCKNSNVLQIYKKGLEFAFVSDNYEQCHNFILCKDFLQDIVYSNINEKTINIFNDLYTLNTMQPPKFFHFYLYFYSPIGFLKEP